MKSSCMLFSFVIFSSLRNVNSPMRLKLINLLQGNQSPERDYLCFKVFSLETVSFLRPFFLRFANTLRPLAVAILSRKPCLFFLFVREGWNVRFIIISVYLKFLRAAKMLRFFWIYNFSQTDLPDFP